MAADLDDLNEKVRANPDTEASVVQLMDGIAAKIDAVKSDPAAVKALASQIKSSANASADAVMAGTSA